MVAMRFALLGSGSRGNALVVEQGTTRVLVDCGFSAREMKKRLARLSLEPADLDGIVITHEHDDHCKGLSRFSRLHGLPVWMTAGTQSALADMEVSAVKRFSPHTPFAIGDLEFAPYPVPHDAREPAQFVIGNGVHRLGVLTDIGHVTTHVRSMVDGCDALVLESNHDSDMLTGGPYPRSLKARVSGRLGHLSNAAAARLLSSIETKALQHVVAAHMSETNNLPALARSALATALNCTPDWVQVADQKEGLSWKSLMNR